MPVLYNQMYYLGDKNKIKYLCARRTLFEIEFPSESVVKTFGTYRFLGEVKSFALIL